MGSEFPLTPVRVDPVATRYRRICTDIPVPESIPLLQRLRAHEPRSMGGQPPIVWQRGEGVCVCDPYGNRWLDFSSGVLVTASGHGHPDIVAALNATADQGLYHAYCFPTEIRARIVEELQSWAPAPLSRVFLLTTGAEATECCLKLARTYGAAHGGPAKSVIVSFHNAFHGRTMGAQLMGGSPGLKGWLGDIGGASFVQVPYPDGWREPDTSFAVFERSLRAQGISPQQVCGVISETYQGCNAALLPAPYAQALRAWCDRHGALLILDEVQAGFGRTGAPFGFSHLGVVPDLVACGKGISGGMPMSAVLGRAEVMDQYGPGEMTSTHSANPLCCAAALANLQVIRRDGLIENARRLAPRLRAGLERIQRAAGDIVGRIDATGLVGAVQFAHPGTTEPLAGSARALVQGCIERGLLLFAPVGVAGSAVKINPPLIIDEAALAEGLEVMVEVAATLAQAEAVR